MFFACAALFLGEEPQRKKSYMQFNRIQVFSVPHDRKNNTVDTSDAVSSDAGVHRRSNRFDNRSLLCSVLRHNISADSQHSPNRSRPDFLARHLRRRRTNNNARARLHRRTHPRLTVCVSIQRSCPKNWRSKTSFQRGKSASGVVPCLSPFSSVSNKSVCPRSWL